eukprot:10607348-Ditylum_brightwellii.AAC.1
MTAEHPLHKHLQDLPLFNIFSGVDEYMRMTMGCEQKHVFKRRKEQIKGEIGIAIYDYKFTGCFLQDMLLPIGTPKDELKEMFNIGFADAMNAPAMVKLYRSVA